VEIAPLYALGNLKSAQKKEKEKGVLSNRVVNTIKNVIVLDNFSFFVSLYIRIIAVP